MKRLTAALVAVLSLLSTHARAEVKPGTQQAAIAVGLANPLSNNSVDDQTETFGKLGPALGLGYLYQLHEYIGIGGDFSYKSLGTRDAVTGHGPVSVQSSAWTLLAVARGDALPDNDIRPYGLMGLGVGGIRRAVDFSQRPDLNSSRNTNGPAFALGVGADYDISDAWLAGAELRYNVIGTSHDEIGASRVSTLDILFKFGCKF
jgi:opacity protein-like surface antigen